MLPRERVFAALEHREPDRIPWGEHSINYNVYEDILGRPSLVQGQFKETQAYWDGRRDEIVESYKRDRLDLVRALEFDIVHVGAVPPRGYRPKPFEKIDAETWRDERGNLFRVSATTHDLMPYRWCPQDYVAPTMESVEREIAELEAQPPDDPNDSRWELVHHTVREMKETHFIMLLCDDMDYPRFGQTEEEGWKNVVRYPELCKKIGELQGKRLIRSVQLFARLGVDGIMPCGDLGSSTAMMASPKIYRERTLPWHRAHAAEAHRYGLKILKHCCGHVMPIIDDLADTYDAYEAIQGSAGMDIGVLKKRVGDRLCLWGGIWHEHIILGTPADIRRDARYAFSTAGPGGGFIMGSTHSLAVDAKVENILEMKRCRDEWGAYPISPARFVPAE
jgi:hypothetical protein